MSDTRSLDPSSSGDPPDVLQVQIDGDRDQPTRIFLISRPRDARVLVREWTSDGWSSGPTERDVHTAELYGVFARAFAERRRLSEDIYRIREWLEGRD